MNTFSITNLNDFAKILRKNAYEQLFHLGILIHLNMTNVKNYDEFITLTEVMKLVSVSGIGLDDDNNIIINEDILEQLINDVSEWICDISLSKLCGANQMDCAWDDVANEMVFWNK